MSKKNINSTSALSEEVKNKSGETALRTEPNQLLSDSVPDIISGKRLLNDCLYPGGGLEEFLGGDVPLRPWNP